MTLARVQRTIDDRVRHDRYTFVDTIEVEDAQEIDADVEEKLCRKCGEWWPKTKEFFLFQRGYLTSPCRVCVLERREEVNQEIVCCIPGCDKPRMVSSSGKHCYSRCARHQQEQNAMQYEREKVRQGTKDRFSRKQISAMVMASRHCGIVDTFEIAGTTGGSLVKKGMMFRHATSEDRGTGVTYELTDQGWQWLRDNGHIDCEVGR